MKKQDSKTIYLEDYQPPKFLIDSTELIFQLYDKETFIISKLFIRRNPDSKDDENTIQLDGNKLGQGLVLGSSRIGTTVR